MRSETTIDVSNFNTWMKDPVTKALFDTLRTVREETEMGMKNADNILAKDCQTRMTMLLGRREILDLILEMRCEDLINEDDADVEETYTASGTQSSSEAEEI